MTKQPASGHDIAMPFNQPHAGRVYVPIYENKAADPTATSMHNRAMQLRSMCKVLILASDSLMNVDLLEALPAQLEVMHQLADELSQHLELEM